MCLECYCEMGGGYCAIQSRSGAEAHDKSLGSQRMVIATGTNVQGGSEC